MTARPRPLQDAILALLRTHRHLSDDQLAARLDKSLSVISKARAALHTDRLVHVSQYVRRKQRGPWVRVWALGDDEDASPPASMRNRAKCKAHRQRKRARLRSVLELLL